MSEFIKIAQDNYLRAKKQREEKAIQDRHDELMDRLEKLLHKLVLASCTVLLVIDALMLLTVIYHQLTH